jgi:tRNA-specific 2-thiouridylase
MKKGKAIGLFSGGLDSILAVKLITEQGFEVIALNMKTPFGAEEFEGKNNLQLMAKRLGIALLNIDTGEEYIELVKNPRYGYGKNMNPCIDCRIFLFAQAKKAMEEEGADFVFSGEVLGERPMSQRRDAMNLIERESGLKGKILRPLSAKLLEPTIMEREGLVERDRLLDLQGRSRKPQLALARKYGIDEFPNPAGGCLLTDQSFSLRVEESFEHGEVSLRHMNLLKVGRHFRTPNGAKIIAGRDKGENEILIRLAWSRELKLTAHGLKSAYLLVLGEPDAEDLKLAARICARYTDRGDSESVPVRIWLDSPEQFESMEAVPLEESLLTSLRIGR